VDDKARIIAETLAPGAVTSEIARRHGMSPQQIFGWRREAKRRCGEGGSCAPSFAPVVLETPATRAPPAGGTAIEIIVGSLVARVPLGADGATLARVAQALKAAS
jgi:transposase